MEMIDDLPFPFPGVIASEQLSPEASTRRFYRLYFQNNERKVLMQLSQDLSHCIKQIVYTQKILALAGIPSANIDAYSETQRWVLQTDLGDTRLWHAFKAGDYLRHSRALVKNLVLLQQRVQKTLPCYIKADFVREATGFMNDYLEPLCLKHWQIQLLSACIERLAEELSRLPYVAMHKDYHSANIMVHQDTLHVIDQQDMCFGPQGYDIASLIYDAYIDWPEAIRDSVLDDFARQIPDLPLSELTQQVKLCALQRHLKCLGLFCRLGKAGNHRYLTYLPRLEKNLKWLCQQLPEYSLLQTYALNRQCSLFS